MHAADQLGRANTVLVGCSGVPSDIDRPQNSCWLEMDHPSLLVLLALGVFPSVADIHISLRNISNQSAHYKHYNAKELFKPPKFTNTNNTMRGYLHQPQNSTDGCSMIADIPEQYRYPKDDGNATVIWIAVLEDYPRCPGEMVNNAESAGYGLILASSANKKNMSIVSELKNLNFPVVIIGKKYYNYLIDHALSNLEEKPEMLATVKTRTQPFIEAIVVVSIVVVVSLPTLCCLCCYWCWVRRRRRRFDTDIRNMAARRQNYRRLQNRDRLARQELVESILRQLHQLQLDSETQQPLGSADTKQLPTERYKKMVGSGPESDSCAICVDNFKDGVMMRVLPCSHRFHLECIDEWLINHSDLCPLCKNQVPRQRSTDGVRFHGGRGRHRGGRGGGRGGAGVNVMFSDEEELEEEMTASPVSSDTSMQSNSRGTRNRLLDPPIPAARYGSV